jgi:DNA-binding response OmpR family regulator
MERMAMPLHLLLIEDSDDLAANIGEFLEARGHVVDYAADGITGLHLATVNRYDAIVLDLGLPGMDGIALCRRLRGDAHNPVPILMLTARDTERDKLAGFEVGADDYLTKPFSSPELLARLQALVRRAAGATITRVLQVADLTLHLDTLVARRGGRRLDLTPLALRLLQHLMAASPRVVARAEVERVLWGSDPPDSDAALRGHIHALRQAVDRDETVRLVHTVHGVGYRLAADDAL